jgi:hypothetical protein
MLYPIRVDWPANVPAGDDYTFTVETSALANTRAVYRPVLRCHNFSTGALDLTITYTLDLGSGDDPLHNGTFTETVVLETIPAAMYLDYNFGGINLAADTTLTVYHNVTIANAGATARLFHAVLFGEIETAVQLPASSPIVRGA